MTDDDLLSEQRAFYRARAPEYDDWWQRRGRYDRGPDVAREWEEQVAEVEAALRRFDPSGDVLELAGGTGWWTRRLADVAGTLTVVDASSETLELNRARVERPDIDYVVGDLFTWRPERRYDVVFFSFWLSHVPRARFGQFWDLVASCLTESGRAFLIDNRHDPTWDRPDPFVRHAAEDVQLRRLSDGSEHRVVKIFYEPPELSDLLADHGWDADIRATRWFIHGTAQLA